MVGIEGLIKLQSGDGRVNKVQIAAIVIMQGEKRVRVPGKEAGMPFCNKVLDVI